MPQLTSDQNEILSQKIESERLNFALQAAGIGVWDLHLGDPDIVIWDDRCKELFGMKKEGVLLYEDAFQYIHEDDRDFVKESVDFSLDPKNGGNFDVRYRTIGVDDGVLRLVRFIGGSYFDKDGNPYRMTGIAMDVTSEMNALNAQIAQSQSEDKFKNVTNTSPTGLWLSDPEGNLTYLNKTLTDWTGMAYADLLGTGWINAIVEEDRENAAKEFVEAIKNKAHYEVEFRLNKKDGNVIWCKAAGDPFYLEDGKYGGYAGFCMDIDERLSILHSLKDSEERVRSIVDQAPVAIGVLRGRDFLVESGNSKILEIWGKTESIFGLKLIDALPELKDQVFIQILENVFDTGEVFHGYETLAKLEQNGVLKDIYVDFVYAPLKNEQNVINGILLVATEVTEQVLAKKMLAESEIRFRGIIEEAPVPTSIFMGKDLKIDIANEAMLKLWGKSEQVIGMKLAEALPELEGQPFLNILENIFLEKKPFDAQEAKADLVVDGTLQTFYFNFTYKPLFDSKGEVYAILNMAMDVTNQVKNRNKIAEAEAKLRIAVDTANLGTWELNPDTDEFIASSRIKKWFGFEEHQALDLTEISKCMPDDTKLIDAINEAKENLLKGEINVEYIVVNQKTNQRHILHTVGQTFFNDQEKAYLLTGSTKDITIHRNTEMQLENLVQIRTKQLQVSNAEMASINEELGETNENLKRSNEELEQYAYVASHDLQEPLRKIRVFSDMLYQQAKLNPESLPMVQKINQSAERMSLLIKDLLEFSRLLKVDQVMEPVDLSSIIKEVVNDFELVISEKNVEISVVDEFPEIEGISLQMNQLFYNLINNALKFTETDRKPVISIKCTKLNVDSVKELFPKYQDQTYYDISIQDNGIGFDEQFSEQIFEVFKRLHGRDLYSGSGIGLALCRRIVSNHNGLIQVESEIGKGSIFHIFLPEKQV